MEDLEDKKDNMKDGEYLTRSNIIMKLFNQATCDCRKQEIKPKPLDVVGSIAMWRIYRLYEMNNGEFVIIRLVDERVQVLHYIRDVGNRNRLKTALNKFREHLRDRYCYTDDVEDEIKVADNYAPRIIMEGLQDHMANGTDMNMVINLA